DVAAESLSKQNGYLVLEGLTSLSDAAAESLSRHKGKLILGGLRSLSVAAADTLCMHQGPVFGHGNSLSGRLHEARNRRLLGQPVNEQLDFLAGVWISLDDQARRKILLLAAGAMSQEE
ncbi:MAG: hypothetical protein O3B13_21415, partial [Planctomycetota bacterium]|nr:hypothetical protein [Planctomycetota bacterium]